MTAKSLSILWSYNERKFPNWLASCVIACRSQGFVWWDVGWPINFDPVDGFIWNTVKGQVTHRALIEDVLHQPDRMKVDEIARNWRALDLPVHEDCPFVLIGQKGKVGTLTILKLTDLELLEKPKNLDAFILCNDKPPSVPPQKYYRVRPVM